MKMSWHDDECVGVGSGRAAEPGRPCNCSVGLSSADIQQSSVEGRQLWQDVPKVAADAALCGTIRSGRHSIGNRQGQRLRVVKWSSNKKGPR